MTSPDFGSHWPLHSFQHFAITECEKSSYIVETGSSFQINGIIKNNFDETGTTYIVIKLAFAENQHAEVLFDSDRDFTNGQKQSLRFEVAQNSERHFSINIPVDRECVLGTLDMRLELWSPGRLRYPAQSLDTVALFYRSPWGNGIDLISPDHLIAKAFFSYSWHSPEHLKWINELAQELALRQIRVIMDRNSVEFGQELTEFMEKAVSIPVIIAICSSSYTKKANDRKTSPSGAGYEASLLSNQILKGRFKGQIIPVIRDNPSKELPDFFNSALYLNMDVEHWKAKPLTDLADKIIKNNHLT
ncbi:TIR domain-containing protein [Flavobacterium zepuense]|uniref:TIR domain-containing protein n=1 Tax=Flavobacterium zepuense TaxID=2593302 RepID=A0A552V9G9_9FLAO|nr:toll/interleukin-1 receptor domain-containing protein [Flavobacterium zepuense]TRW27113.1 TIR domain-containing protein [Flavobacterium zepuense]